MDVKQRKTKSDRPAVFSQPTPKKATPEEPTPPAKKRYKPTKKTVILTAIGLLIVCWLVWLIASGNDEQASKNDEPGYTSILPQNKTIDSLGGWQRVSPPENDPVYAYNDSIDGVAISVSEQPLPKQFKNSTSNHVAELAKGYNATTKLKAGDTVVYVGASSKGPQSVIFTKEGLLVLIKSEKTLADASWSAYVKSLSSSNLENLPKY